MSKLPGLWRVALAAIVGIAGAACSGDDVTDPRGDLRPQATIDSPDDDFDNTTDIGHAYVCVESPVAGTYGFDISGTLGGPGGNIAPIIHVDPANVTPGTCVDVAHAGEGVIFFNPNVITADETSNPGGVVLLHVRVEEARYTTQPGGPAVLLGVDTTQSADPASGDVANEKAAKLVFVYDVQPVGGEGCTPGYWKQSQHFGNWTGYDPATLFVDAGFEDVFPGMTLLEVLGQGGGGLKALGRHAVAALLNAAYGLDYGMTAQQIIDAFNAAVPDGDIEGLLGDLVAANESSCPLARAE